MDTNSDLEKRILHIILIKSYHLPSLGLLSGKMGISLFFIHYFIKTGKQLFQDYAYDLIDKITDEINQHTPLGLDTGLAGIGWGVEYLIRNEFIEGEGIDICEAIDNRIMQTDPRRINDLSLENGLEGLLHYVLSHIQGAKIKKTDLPFDSIYLNDLYTAVSSIPLQNSNNSMQHLIKSYKNFYIKREDINYDIKLNTFTGKIKVNDNSIHTLPLGLKEGLAGYIFNSYINP